MRVITLWLAVDESTKENGCMRVIPGSHKEIEARIKDAYEEVDRSRNVFSTRIRPEMFDESKAVDLELKVGECHFHDAWTIHGSNPNVSEKRRCGYTMRYMPADVVHAPESWSRGHRIYLVRGQDRTGGKNEYAPIPPF
jgi:ectoine hydroxylase-related dioxygenase (phytanoyl-CoA dioxygenase family)